MKINQKIMSAILGSVLIFYAATLISCKNQPDSDSENSTTLKGVTSLFIVNPTKQKKNYDDTWVKIETVERAAGAETPCETLNLSTESSYIEHTIPFSDVNFEINEKKTRSATTKYQKKYVKGQQHTFSDAEYIKQTKIATMRYEGEFCYIWTFDDEPNDSKMTDEEITSFAATFDNIYLKETALCGPKYQGETVLKSIITPNAKISLVLYDIAYDRGTGKIYGYFHPEMYYIRQSGANEIEAIFVDSYFAKQKEIEKNLFSTVSHELNHLLNFANKTLKYGTGMNSWYTEMLSMVTEDFFMNDLNLSYENSPQQRLEAFVSGCHSYGFGNWNYNNNDLVSFNYANAYAFGAFLARNYGGAKLIHEIATNEYVDEESVVKAVNKINNTNLTFTDLLNKFSLIMINTQNQNSDLPSLKKTCFSEITEEISLIDGSTKKETFSFNLTEIDLTAIKEIVASKNVYTNRFDIAFDSYGFLFYHFDKHFQVIH